MPVEKRIKEKFFISGFLLSVIFFVLSIFVSFDMFRYIDYISTTTLQKVLPRSLDVPFSYVTLLGSSEITVIILIFIFFMFYLKRKKMLLSLILFFLLFPIELLGKIYIFHPQTPDIFHRFSLGFHFPSSFIIRTQYSYPSGHSARAAFLAVVLIYITIVSAIPVRKKWLYSFLIFMYILIVVISRIYLGEHWASDVFGGIILGTSLALFTITLEQNRLKNISKREALPRPYGTPRGVSHCGGRSIC